MPQEGKVSRLDTLQEIRGCNDFDDVESEVCSELNSSGAVEPDGDLAQISAPGDTDHSNGLSVADVPLLSSVLAVKRHPLAEQKLPPVIYPRWKGDE